jgi:hypothetical protein
LKIFLFKVWVSLFKTSFYSHDFFYIPWNFKAIVSLISSKFQCTFRFNQSFPRQLHI